MSRRKPVVAVDLLGSDKGPEEIAEGVRLAMLSLRSSVEILPVGPAKLVHDLMATVHLRADFCTEVKGDLRSRNSSVAIATGLVARGEADALVSFGDTRSAVVWAARDRKKRGLGLVEGVTRPPLALIAPTLKGGKVVILDAGANVDCLPEDLLCFAKLGRAFVGAVMCPVEPVRVGLLSNGEEPTKGNVLTKAAFKLLGEQLSGSASEFVGNVQPTDAISGEVDVVITDGFDGNIDFKAKEAGVLLAVESLKRNLKALRWWRKLGVALIRPALDEVKRELAPEEFGSMPLLGVNGIVMIGHGSADRRAAARGIEEAAKYARLDLATAIAEYAENQGS